MTQYSKRAILTETSEALKLEDVEDDPSNPPPDSSGQPPQADQSSSKKPKLDSNTPIFKGGNVDNWLFVVNQNFALAKINNQDKLKVISSYLRGRLLQTLIREPVWRLNTFLSSA